MRRHAVDLFSLVFGALFATLALGFLVADPDGSGVRLRWAWPAAVAVVGLLIIVAALRGGRDPARLAAKDPGSRSVPSMDPGQPSDPSDASSPSPPS